MDTKIYGYMSDKDFGEGKEEAKENIFNEARNAEYDVPIVVEMLLEDVEFGEVYDGVCTIDYYCTPGGFEKRLTAYGKIRAEVCAGGFDGCSGPEITNEYEIPLCQNCISELAKQEAGTELKGNNGTN